MNSILQRNPLPIAVLLAALMSLWIVSGGIAGAGGPSTTLTQGNIDLVYVASGEGFPDALGVGPVAAVNGAPIILVPKNPPLHSSTSAELVRLDPRKVVIVGGTAVVSAEIQTDIAALLPDAEIERLAGSNRYVTNAMVSESLFPREDWVAIPASSFHSDEPSTDDFVSTGSYAYLNDIGNLYATVQLPHGARIIGLRADMVDETGTDVIVTLRRGGLEGDEAVITTISSVGDTGEQSDFTSNITNGLEFVDNAVYSYWIEVTGTSNTGPDDENMIRRVMVQYRLGNADALNPAP